MTSILDENLPKPLKGTFPRHAMTTVQERGLAGTVNGPLLARLEGFHHRRQEPPLPVGRRPAVLEMLTNRLPLLRPWFARIAAAVDAITPSAYVQLTL